MSSLAQSQGPPRGPHRQGLLRRRWGCGEEYISGTQNGFNNAPQVLSVVPGANGGVAVVIQRSTANPRSPNLTAVMTVEGGKWLASDLASGTGANASIFAAKPDC